MGLIHTNDWHHFWVRYRAAVKNLIFYGLKPTRGVVPAFGFDEVNGPQVRRLRSSPREIVAYSSLKQGARRIAKPLLSSFGENAFAFIIDEGGTGLNLFSGSEAVLTST